MIDKFTIRDIPSSIQYFWITSMIVYFLNNSDILQSYVVK